MTKDYLITFWTVCLLVPALAGFLVYFVLQSNKRSYRTAVEEARNKANQQNELLRSIVRERENTFDFISRELHDHYGQMLRLLQMNLQVVKDFSTHKEQGAMIDTCSSLAQQLMTQLQHISRTLNTDFIQQQGLITVIESDVRQFRSMGTPDLSFSVKGSEERYPPGVELGIYRIFQEATSNALRHAEATVLAIRLHYYPKGLTLTVTDNGIGFDTETPLKNSGLGRRSMLQRAELIGAALVVQSKKNRGTCVEVNVQKEDK